MESSILSSVEYFQEQVLKGNWDIAEEYLSDLISKDDGDPRLIDIFFEIKKQKYLEALDENNVTEAKEILTKELKTYDIINVKEYEDLSQLLKMPNFRQHEFFGKYETAKSARANVVDAFKRLIDENPLFQQKIHLPILKGSSSLSRTPLGIESHDDQPSLSDNFSKSLLLESGVIEESSEIPSPVEVYELYHCKSVMLSIFKPGKVRRLIYTHAGTSIIGMGSDPYRLWAWKPNDCNGKGTVIVIDHNPDFYVSHGHDEFGEGVWCLALTDEGLVISSHGGNIALFCQQSNSIQWKLRSPPPVATCIILYPRDKNIIIIGMEDSTIKIYRYRDYKNIMTLECHGSKKITGLAFSQVLDVLVSADENAQLCVWKWNTWEKQRSTFLEMGDQTKPLADTRVQFKRDEIHFLVVHRTQLAVYKTTNLECVNKWSSLSEPITDATLSCDSIFVCSTFEDAAIYIFRAENLQLLCRIDPSAYLPRDLSSKTYPLAVAAHPSKTNEIVLGLNDGSVVILELPEPPKQWGVVDITNSS